MAWRHRNDPHQHQYQQHHLQHHPQQQQHSHHRPEHRPEHRPIGYGHNTMSSGYSRPFSGHSNYPPHPSSAAFYRPSSPSVTTSSSDDREEVPMVRHPPRRPYSRGSRLNHHGGSSHSLHHAGLGHHQPVPSIMDNYHHMHPMHGGPNHMGTFRNGTLRSTRSVPALALATWDGEPCPVHGGGPPVFPPSGPPTMRRYGSLFDVRGHPGPPMLYPPPPPSVMMDKKSMHGSMQMLAMPFPPHGYPPPSSHQGHGGPPQGGPFPPHFLAPTLMRGRPMVIPAGAEPLPIRDPFKLRTPPPQFVAKMDEDDYTMDQVCCKGHLIVLWIILGVVTVGVILGIILGVTIA